MILILKRRRHPMFEELRPILIRQLWQISLLIPATILALRLLPRRSPHLHHAILLVVLLKCLVPPVWVSPVGIFSWVVPVRTSVAAVAEAGGSPSPESPPAESPPNKNASVESSGSLPADEAKGVETPWSPVPTSPRSSLDADNEAMWRWLPLGWFAGCLALTGYVIGKGRQLQRFHEETEAEPSEELRQVVKEISSRLGLRRPPRLLITVHPVVPFAAGIFRPRVVLPEDAVATATGEELRLILAHEITHLRRGDLLVSAVQVLVQLVWWFHPLVWWLNREIRRVRELCVDADVVVRSGCEPRSYADCLLRMLELRLTLHERRGLAALSPFEVTAQRLKNVMSLREPVHSLGWWPRAVVFLLAAGMLLPGAALPDNRVSASVSLGPERDRQILRRNEPELSAPHENSVDASDADGPQGRSPTGDRKSSGAEDHSSGEIGPAVYAVTVSLGTAPGLTRHRASLEFLLLPLEFDPSERVIQGFDPQFSPRFSETLSPVSGGSGIFPRPIPPSEMGLRRSLFSGPLPSPGVFLNRGLRPIDSVSPALPGILGDPTDLIFPPISGPVLPQGTYTHNRTGAIRSETSIVLADGTRSIETLSLPADFTSEIQTGELLNDRLVLHRVWTVQTQQGDGPQPSLRGVLRGEIEIDLVRLIPIRAAYRGEMERRDADQMVVTPIDFEARRVLPPKL